VSILGNRVVRTEDPKFLTTGGVYLADLADPLLDGAAFVTFVRSTVAHATFTVNVVDARGGPGVLGVYTAADLDIGPVPPGMAPPTMSRPIFATGTVRFVGEILAAIVTERADQGEDAAELVWAEYEPLEVVVDPEAAAADSTLLFPEHGTNCALEFNFGRDDALFEGCEVVVSEKVVNQRVNACPMEVRGAAAAWGDDGRLHLFMSTQHAHGVRNAVATLHGLTPDQVRVVAPDVGGGFGAKIDAGPEELVVPWLARTLGRPVRWHETRSENMVAMGHGRAQVQLLEIGGSRDGRVEAYRLSVLQDAGGYPAVGAVLPYLTRMMAAGVYDIARIECNTSSVVTNTTPVVAYRGAGRPEAAAAIERAMDLFAAEIGMDPAEVRHRNLIAPFDEPVTTAIGTTYDCGDYTRALDLALSAAGYVELRAEQARRREAGDVKALGIGVAVYVEVTAGPTAGGEFADVQVHPDGSATILTGASPHGQGHATSFAMIASEQTGIPMERITVVHGDTDVVARGEGTMGSRSLQLGGSAVFKASDEVVDQARSLAAELLEASVDDVVLDKVDGQFHVQGTPSIAKTWSEVATEAAARHPGAGIQAAVDFTSASPTFPFGAHVAVVEVDTDTGQVTLQRLVACDDAGRVLNPLIVEGQRHGGLAQGAAQALMEEVRYDDGGNPVTANLADYAMISAAELPSFELVSMETPTSLNPLGAKGVGESGTIGSTPAVQSAVCDALAHLGVRHVDIPCTSERVWRAIQAARGMAPA
jgi:carbon-monoxide dehydrogenase large subunit